MTPYGGDSSSGGGGGDTDDGISVGVNNNGLFCCCTVTVFVVEKRVAVLNARKAESVCRWGTNGEVMVEMKEKHWKGKF